MLLSVMYSSLAARVFHNMKHTKTHILGEKVPAAHAQSARVAELLRCTLNVIGHFIQVKESRKTERERKRRELEGGAVAPAKTH
jgi:hypothetical protein